MTAEQWGILIPAIVGVLAAIAAYLRANSAHKRIDENHPDTKK